ncbi:MAG: starvation-sensing protein RspA [Planctomycetes bacterium]|nr:starvation-sensing protein RspA [Planctomycetota bacterium]
MSAVQIRDVRTILTQPGGVPLIVVKVITSDPGLFGLGCSTFTWRHRAVHACLEHHLKPFLIGKDAANIEDIWQSGMVGGYWRNGPVLNNALSGVDMALWDIKGKMAGMPCYQLWGGLSRQAAAVYVHANGRDKHEVTDNAQKLIARGFRYIRCQLGGYQGVTDARNSRPDGSLPGAYFDPREKLRLIPDLFSHLRQALPDEVELLYDVHERLAPMDAAWLAKALEQYRLFFVEDVLPPEDLEWFATIRSQCATPLAMGELFCHPGEIVPLVSRRLIDFIRVHPSAIGGVTPCLKLAHLGELFGLRTAWHGPLDVSPVGMAANVHMDVCLHNFGIQEWALRGELEQEMFPGTPQIKGGYVYPNDRPGLGIDLDEDLAGKHPCKDRVPGWTVARFPDGTIGRP